MNSKNVMLVISFILVFFVGFMLGRSGIDTPINAVSDNVEEAVTNNDANQTAEDTNQTGGTPVAAQLTEGQRKMIESFGLDPNNVTITPEMVACAEAKLGSARMEEIKNGATPSFSEGASLVACYR